MSRQHDYNISIEWTGNSGRGTEGYSVYERSYTITAEHKSKIAGSADPAFRGDKSKYNPEELLLAAASSCHMLSYLHLCAVDGVIVTGYVDRAMGTMKQTENGGGKFTSITLHPKVTVANESMIEKANQLHSEANAICFIARSLNFPVLHAPECIAG